VNGARSSGIRSVDPRHFMSVAKCLNTVQQNTKAGVIPSILPRTTQYTRNRAPSCEQKKVEQLDISIQVEPYKSRNRIGMQVRDPPQQEIGSSSPAGTRYFPSICRYYSSIYMVRDHRGCAQLNCTETDNLVMKPMP